MFYSFWYYFDSVLFFSLYYNSTQLSTLWFLCLYATSAMEKTHWRDRDTAVE